MKYFLIAVCGFVVAVADAQAGHHEGEGEKQEVVIGTVFSDDGSPYSLLAGDTALQQIWVDYINAHNDRDLKKIARINAENWTGYPPDGTVIKGNTAHIEWLDAWFKTSDEPKWKVKWMIANTGPNEQGEMETWLTTGNDITFNDVEGNSVTEHHVHDVQFTGEQIKLINVYSRPTPAKH